MHHTRHHGSRTRQFWQGLIYITTALVALVLYRVANLPLVAAILIGFIISTIIAAIGYALWRHHDKHGPGP